MNAHATSRILRAGALALAFFLAPLPCNAGTAIPVYAANADQVLQPGDVMIKLANEKSSASTWGVVVTEAMMQAMYRSFSDAVTKGNAAAVHVAIYVGNGETAEAHNSSDEDKATTGLRKLGHHAGYLWFVFRPRNARLGADAAAIARSWATGRMGYKQPWDVPFHNSNFGPFAKREAMGYGKAAYTSGGPPSESEMFCSQFVIAVYQAAVVASELKANRNLDPDNISMYPGVDRHASKTSPLVMHGHLKGSEGSKGFQDIGLIVTQLAPKPGLRPPEGGKIEFVSLKGYMGKCLDAQWLAGKQVAGKGSWVHLWDCNGGANQKWKFANGRLESAVAGQCLAVDSGKLEPGRQLILWDCHTGNDERWEARSGKLAVTTTQLCADVKGENFLNGTPIILYACGAAGKLNQQWFGVP